MKHIYKFNTYQTTYTEISVTAQMHVEIRNLKIIFKIERLEKRDFNNIETN